MGVDDKLFDFVDHKCNKYLTKSKTTTVIKDKKYWIAIMYKLQNYSINYVLYIIIYDQIINNIRYYYFNISHSNSCC